MISKFDPTLPAPDSRILSAPIRSNFNALNDRSNQLTPASTVPVSTTLTVGLADKVYFEDSTYVPFPGTQLDLGSTSSGVSSFVIPGTYKEIIVYYTASASVGFIESIEKTTPTRDTADLVNIVGNQRHPHPLTGQSTAVGSISPLDGNILICSILVQNNGTAGQRGQIVAFGDVDLVDLRPFIQRGGNLKALQAHILSPTLATAHPNALITNNIIEAFYTTVSANATGVMTISVTDAAFYQVGSVIRISTTTGLTKDTIDQTTQWVTAIVMSTNTLINTLTLDRTVTVSTGMLVVRGVVTADKLAFEISKEVALTTGLFQVITGFTTTYVLSPAIVFDINVAPSAAIQGTKIVPNFGSQTVSTTGTVTASIFSGGAFNAISSAPSGTPAFGTARSYAILGASAVTGSTGAGSTLTGNLGISPGTSITNFPPSTYTGSLDVANGAANTAHASAQAAYTDLSTRPAGTAESALDGLVLTPGTYTSGSSMSLADSGAGTLTLNGAGIYIFQIGSTLTTGAGGTPTITLTGGATAANIYWVVGSSATLNSGFSGTFHGNVIAQASITVTLGGTVNGTLTTLTGAVTLSATTAVNAVVLPGSGSLAADSFVTAGTSITAGTTITAGTSITAGTTITAGTGITATTGNITASSGNISASGTVTAGSGMTSTSGNITATSGNINATTGSITAGTDITASGVFKAGTAPTTLTDTVGKIFSNALNTVQIAQGGTALTTLGTANQLLGANPGATALEYKTISGSTIANPNGSSVTVTSTAGSIVIATAQNIAATSSVVFAGLTITPFGTAGVVHNNASGVFSSSLIVDVDVSATAAITRSKLASGTANYVVTNNGTGVMSESQFLIVTQGGTGSVSFAVPVSGHLTVVTASGTSAFSSVDATTLAIGNTLVYRDGSGNFSGATITATTGFSGPIPATNLTGVVSPTNGGTGISNNAASTLTITGNFGLTFTIGSATSVTLPASGTLATLAGVETFTNKTLSGNTSSNFVNGAGTLLINSTGTITVPNATDTLVGKATTDVLTNKTLSGNTATNFVNGAGTLQINSTGTITVPNATDTLVGRITTDTLTNKTISGASNTITNISLTTAVTGILPPSNGGTGVNNNAASTITISGSFGLTLTLSALTSVTLPTSGTLATLTGIETLTNKTLTSPTIATILNTGTLTLPTITTTLVGRTTTDTLTNKTLTTPVISGGTINVDVAGNLVIGGSVGANTITLGSSSPASTVYIPGSLQVGSTSQFQVDGYGNLTRINDVSYTWPATQGTPNTVLTDNAGLLTWENSVTLAHVTTATFVEVTDIDVTTGPTVTFDATLASVFYHSITMDTTYVITGMVEGQTVYLIVQNTDTFAGGWIATLPDWTSQQIPLPEATGSPPSGSSVHATLTYVNGTIFASFVVATI